MEEAETNTARLNGVVQKERKTSTIINEYHPFTKMSCIESMEDIHCVDVLHWAGQMKPMYGIV